MIQHVKQSIEAAVKDLFGVAAEASITRPDEQFGDYATNVALPLARQLQKNPREVAAAIIGAAKDKTAEYVKSMEVAGAGFINIRLHDGVLLTQARQAADTVPDIYKGKTVVIETNNPNPFKDLHIGHAYNSIVADTIANLLARGQANLHRVSYHGDVGLHVGKSMWAILRYIKGNPDMLDSIAEPGRPQFLSSMYAEGAQAYEQDDLAKQQIEEFAKQSFTLPDETFKRVYETCKAWSLAYFDQTFAQIGSKPIENRYLERATDAAGRQVVEDNIGPVFERSEGAIIFPGEKYGLHTRVFINSRGTTLYEARDLGLIQLKEKDFHPDLSFIVTAIEQKEYFRVVFKAADLALPELAGKTINIPTGTVKLSTGKMSSRTGNVVNIGWLFDEITKALRQRGSTEESIAGGLIGALRYSMLKVRIGGDVVFDVNEAISLEGNSGPYLQYAHARARSILGKASLAEPDTNELEAEERVLVRKITEYPEVVERAVEELLPHHICTYLYELAQVFNRFYERNRVLGDAREAVRVELVKLYADTLRNGLEVLGIPAPERM